MRTSTSSYIVELPLRVNDQQNRFLEKAFEFGRTLYNATLGTALGRLQRMRETKEWREAMDMAKGRDRTKAFNAIHKSFGLTEIGLVTIANDHRKASGRNDIGAHEAQNIGKMDFANDGPRRPGEVGIDLGIVQTVTLSDGTVFQLDVESIKKQIAVLQRQLCRNKEARQNLVKLGKANPFDKRGPSRMRRRLKAQIQNHYRCIRNTRRDFMLKTAHTIAQNYGWVAIEDLKLKNMTKSAKGTVEEPGKNVRQKAGLNRSLARVAPYAMRMAIHWAYSRLILVDPKYTSQSSPICGYTSSSNWPSQAYFGCQTCGATANADYVAAGNILKKSRTGSVRPCCELTTRQQREPSFSSRINAK